MSVPDRVAALDASGHRSTLRAERNRGVSSCDPGDRTFSDPALHRQFQRAPQGPSRRLGRRINKSSDSRAGMSNWVASVAAYNLRHTPRRLTAAPTRYGGMMNKQKLVKIFTVAT